MQGQLTDDREISLDDTIGRVRRLLAWCRPPGPEIVEDNYQPAALAALAELSLAYNIAPLFYDRIRERSLDTELPAELLARLRKSANDVAILNLRRQATLIAIARACAAASIPLIVLKGIYLASVIYRSVSLRPMVDMDILVRREQLAAATAVLQRLGFSQLRDISSDVDVAVAHHLTPFVRPGAGTIELHWNITPPACPYSIDPDILWKDLSPFQLAGETLYTLPRERLIAHLACHVSHQHYFRAGIRPLLDLAHVIRFHRGQIDWPLVIRYSADSQWSRGVYLALRLARDLAETEVPTSVLLELQPPDIDDDLIECAQHCLVADRAKQVGMPPALGALQRHLGIVGTIRHGLRRVFLPRMAIAKAYAVRPSSRLLPFYYVLRARDLMRRHALTMARCVLGTDRPLADFASRQARVVSWLNDEPL